MRKAPKMIITFTWVDKKGFPQTTCVESHYYNNCLEIVRDLLQQYLNIYDINIRIPSRNRKV